MLVKTHSLQGRGDILVIEIPYVDSLIDRAACQHVLRATIPGQGQDGVLVANP